jgi:hypothetical protein
MTSSGFEPLLKWTSEKNINLVILFNRAKDAQVSIQLARMQSILKKINTY